MGLTFPYLYLYGPVFFYKTISVECETPAGKTIKIILPINLFDHKNIYML